MLSNEDSLRLQVLLRQSPHVIRINESNMTLHALTPKGEASIKLNPNCRDEKYLSHVREVLSNHALGSPEGYPIFLRRWRRMEERRSENLRPLLLIGEPEAFIDVAHAPHLDEELASYVWWAMQTSEIARLLLRNPTVAKSELGRTLVDFLLEFLPFETEPQDIVETIGLLLQPGLLSEQEVSSLWKRAERKVVFYIGFLQSMPDDLPLQASAHTCHEKVQQALQGERRNNSVVQALCRLYSPQGQAFLQVLKKSLSKLPNQETTLVLFNAVQNYFSELSLVDHVIDELEQVQAYNEQVLQAQSVPELVASLSVLNGDDEALRALMLLSQVQESWLNPIFSRTDAVGSVMRKKLKPLTDPLIEAIDVLTM